MPSELERMKQILASLSLLACITLFSCNKNTPKEVAQEWLTAFYHQDYDDAKKLSTEETKFMVNTCQGFSSCLPDSLKQKAKKVTISIKDVKIEGDKATVLFTASNAPTQQEPPLKLVKQNEKWLVQFTKSDFKQDDASPNNPMGGGATITLDNPAPPPANTPSDAAMLPDTTKQQQPQQ